jgi:hypothetical protein
VTRPATRHGDTGSLPLALLLTMVGMMVSALVVPTVLTQIRSTRTDVRRIHALNAAQAGLDVALGHLRASHDAAGAGTRASLPCGPLAGRASVGGTVRYQVTIDYLATDPLGQPDSWIAANRIPCVPGSGTLTTPTFALLRSQGTDQLTGSFASAPSRYLRATYTFHNVVGGLIHAGVGSSSTDLCLDAGSSSPASGTNLLLQPCSTGSGQQRFAYVKNLNLVLVASKTPALPQGMCIDAGDIPHVAADPVQVQPCAAGTQPRQQWIHDSTNFEGTADGTTSDKFCFTALSPDAPASFVVLGKTTGSVCQGGYEPHLMFLPEAAAGTGAAGLASGQLVSFNQYGRCLTAPDANVHSGLVFSSPCAQAPDPANVPWNQKWALPPLATGSVSGIGPITTTQPSGSLYCLRSPGPTTPGAYVTYEECPTGAPPVYMTWTVYTDTGSYATSYRVADGYGNCLAPEDFTGQPPELYPQGVPATKIVVVPCTGSTLQKWDAPPTALQSLPLRDIGER